jgi:hypothetical protein
VAGRTRRIRQALAVGIGVAFHLLSLTPAAASLIYCISTDDHGGFERVPGIERACGSCCKDEVVSREAASGKATDCTDVVVLSGEALLKGSVTAALEPGPAFAWSLSTPIVPRGTVTLHEDHGEAFEPPRGLPIRTRRLIVLQV